MKVIKKAIATAQNKLIKKVKAKGLYENFGQKEVGKLEDKFIDISSYTSEMNEKRDLIQSFNKWCMNYSG